MYSVKLFAVGDICLQTKKDKHPFKKVVEILKEKDILFGNLETVLSKRGKEVEKSVLLHTSPNKAGFLTDVGFDVLNIANNHIMDLGIQGFNETLEVLNCNNISFIGAGNKTFKNSYAIMERKGIKLGFAGYYEGGLCDFRNGVFIDRIDEVVIREKINALKLKCDVIIISLHWGIENVFYPSPEQIKLARSLIDEGATLIIGHHPHVVQGIEKYKKGLIIYSLGNFQFVTNREKTRESIIISVEVSRNGIEDYRIIPVRINEDYLPCVMNVKEKEDRLSFIEEISRPILDNIINERWWFEEIASEHLRGNMESWIKRIKKYGIRHLLQCIRWLISPFIIKCYLGLIRRNIRKT